MLRTMYVFPLAVLLMGAIVASSDAQQAQQKTSTAAAAAPAPAKKGEEGPVNTTVIRFQSGQNLAGGLMDTEEVAFNSTFGNIKIPLHTVAGIKFADKGEPSSTIVMRNGDIITGEVLLGEVKVATTWGEANVNTSSVSSIVFAPGMDWTQSRSADQSKWTLTNKGGTTSNMNSQPNSTANGGYRVIQGR